LQRQHVNFCHPNSWGIEIALMGHSFINHPRPLHSGQGIRAYFSRFAFKIKALSQINHRQSTAICN